MKSFIWKIFLLIPGLIMVHSATIDRNPTALSKSNNFPAAETESGDSSPTFFSRRSIKIATRQLIEHDGFMHIAYDNGVLCSRTLYYPLLSTALTRIIYNIHILGDDAILEEPFVHTIGTMKLQAGHDRRSALRDMTWGVLGEAVEVLEEFTAIRPFPMMVGLREGLDGHGLPVGRMEVTVDASRGNATVNGGGVQVE
ncbi:MAG: hypothetical protein Q9200_002180 [Gallowayella weberi]